MWVKLCSLAIMFLSLGGVINLYFKCSQREENCYDKCLNCRKDYCSTCLPEGNHFCVIFETNEFETDIPFDVASSSREKGKIQNNKIGISKLSANQNDTKKECCIRGRQKTSKGVQM